jgi:hypothetical protein
VSVKKQSRTNAMKVSLTFYDVWTEQLQVVAKEVFGGNVERCVEELAKSALFNLILQARKAQAEAEKAQVIDVKVATEQTETIVALDDSNVSNTSACDGQGTEQPSSPGVST